MYREKQIVCVVSKCTQDQKSYCGYSEDDIPFPLSVPKKPLKQISSTCHISSQLSFRIQGISSKGADVWHLSKESSFLRCDGAL